MENISCSTDVPDQQANRPTLPPCRILSSQRSVSIDRGKDDRVIVVGQGEYKALITFVGHTVVYNFSRSDDALLLTPLAQWVMEAEPLADFIPACGSGAP
jgi:hypothetical protein